MKYYKRSANQGNARAQYQIGLMYYHGYGVDKDFTYVYSKSHTNLVESLIVISIRPQNKITQVQSYILALCTTTASASKPQIS